MRVRIFTDSIVMPGPKRSSSRHRPEAVDYVRQSEGFVMGMNAEERKGMEARLQIQQRKLKESFRRIIKATDKLHRMLDELQMEIEELHGATDEVTEASNTPKKGRAS